jgi:hypothetical protein
MIVIKSEHQLEVGKTYGHYPWEHMTDHQGNDWQSPAFVVIGEATFEDYCQSIEKNGFSRYDLKDEWIEGRKFYFVQMD